MKSQLYEIVDTIAAYTDIMSKVIGVSVEVVDNHFCRVTGSGIFKDHVGEDLSGESYVYRRVLKQRKVEVIYDPGQEEICKDCPNHRACYEEMEISMPILLPDGDVVGFIGLIASTKQEKEQILRDEKMYLDLVAQIAEFIAVKVMERKYAEEQTALADTLNFAINRIKQGVLIYGDNDTICMANDGANNQLKIPELVGISAPLTEMGDAIGGDNEYELHIGDKSFHVMGVKEPLANETLGYKSIFVFRTKKEIHNEMYELSTPRPSMKIIGNSAATRALKEQIHIVAKSTSSVLISGESGTGKELVATAIWRESDRADKRFVAINCGAIPDNLLESELFGYVKGSFTGADPNGRIGKFELANHGVLFLDEIGEMPLYMQVKLLRFLQERTIQRIGSNHVVPIDVRIIAATNRNLKQMVQEHKFREDLYYRLNVISMHVESLSHRREDIPELTYFFADQYAKLFRKKFVGVEKETMKALEAHRWRGNVRELENTVEFMMNMVSDDGVLCTEHLPQDFFEEGEWSEEPASPLASTTHFALEDEVRKLAEVERMAIEHALEKFGTDTAGKKEAAKALGISVATLYRKLT